MTDDPQWDLEENALRKEIERLERLLVRSANALQSFVDCELSEVVAYDLIKEIRKALI